MLIEHILVAVIAAIGPTLAAIAAWRSASGAKRNTEPVANGWTAHVTEELGEIKGLLTAHCNDERAHLPATALQRRTGECSPFEDVE